MLWIVFVLLVVLWIIGWTFGVAPPFIHLLLVIALALAVFNIAIGRRAA